jgi:hypothetical protein
LIRGGSPEGTGGVENRKGAVEEAEPSKKAKVFKAVMP